MAEKFWPEEDCEGTKGQKGPQWDKTREYGWSREPWIMSKRDCVYEDNLNINMTFTNGG